MADAPTERSWFGHSQSVVALASALVALVVSAVTGFYTLYPALSPEKKEKVAAKLEVLVYDRNVTLGEYFVRAPHRTFEEGERDRNGNVFYIRAAIEGFKREELRVRWFTYEATNQVRVGKLSSTAPLEEIFRPQASVNTQIAQVWVPTPPSSGDYFVRFELHAKGNVLLSYVDSSPFPVEQL